MATSRTLILCLILLFVSIYAFAQEDAYLFSNFTSGELTRKLDARLDFKKFFNGARTLENMIVYPQGGVAKRPGFKYIAETRQSHMKSRLIPFVFSDTQAYILEFGEGYIQFYMDGGQLQSGSSAYMVSTSFAEEDLADIKFTQSADVLYITHSSYAPQKLSRSGHTNWTLQDVNFLPGPISEEGHELAADLILAQATVSGVSMSGVSAHSTAAVFLAGDVDRVITCGAGRAIISGVTDASHIQVTIVDAFSGVTCEENDWTVEGTPSTYLVCWSAKVDKGEETYCDATGGNTFRSADDGKYIGFHDGIIRITEVTSNTRIWGEIMSDLDTYTSTKDWTLNDLMWSLSNGYPSCVEFFEERLFFAGSTTYPQTVWGSQTGDYENFIPGAEDDDSVEFAIAADQVNVIKWIKAIKKLLVGTTGGEWWMSGSGEWDPITPSSITIRRESTFGSEDINPVVIDNSALFVQKPGKKLRR